MLSSLLRKRVWSKRILSSSFSTSSERPLWLKDECLQLHKNLHLKNPESSQKLLDIFLDPTSFKLLHEDQDEVSKFLNTKIGDAEESKGIEDVCKFLTSPFDSKLLTTNTIQTRFGEGKFRFFWNIHILQAYTDAINMNKKIHYLTGPRNFGKSFNLALFRNILFTNVSENRVIYVHNPRDLFADKYPFQWILSDLQFTFAHELQMGDQEVIEAFNACYDCIGGDNKVQEQNLEKLLSINPKRGKKQILLIDQQNILSKNTTLNSQNLIHDADREKNISARVIVTQILPRGCHRILQIASMTDEGYEKSDQEVITTFLYDALPEEMTRQYIQISSENSFKPDEIDTIIENSKRVPGEVTSIMEAKGATINEKVQNYFNKRIGEIQKDFNAFEFKKKEKTEWIGQDAKRTMAMLSAYVDTKFRPPVPVNEQYYDMRYIKMENGLVKSLFPAVRKALISHYSPRDELLRLMEQMYSLEQLASFGSIYDTFIVDIMRRVDHLNPIRMSLQGGEKDGKDENDVREFEFNSPLKEISLESIDKIDLTQLTSDTLIIPISKYFEGVDLMIYLPNKNILLVIQLKYKNSLFHLWKRFCRGEGASQAPKEKLTIHFQKQVSGISVKFVLGFLISEKEQTDISAKIAKSLGSDIYCWHTNEIPGLGLLRLVRESSFGREPKSF